MCGSLMSCFCSRYQVDDVYVEVEEHDYHALNDDADFVEDDDNAGYIDDGLGNDEEEFSDEYDQADRKTSKYYLYSS